MRKQWSYIQQSDMHVSEHLYENDNNMGVSPYFTDINGRSSGFIGQKLYDQLCLDLVNLLEDDYMFVLFKYQRLDIA